jgi:hypothetical protein
LEICQALIYKFLNTQKNQGQEIWQGTGRPHAMISAYQSFFFKGDSFNHMMSYHTLKGKSHGPITN